MQIGSGITISGGVRLTPTPILPDPGGLGVPPSPLPGLYRRTYTGYFADTPDWFDSASIRSTGISTSVIGLTGFDTGDLFSIQWLGYFKPQVTGIHTFFTNSDDGSYVWIGTNAISGYTIDNALVSNGGLHTVTERSNSVMLIAHEENYYPIRIQYGDYNGAQRMSVSYSAPTIAKTTNFYNLLYYNSWTNGI